MLNTNVLKAIIIFSFLSCVTSLNSNDQEINLKNEAKDLSNEAPSSELNRDIYFNNTVYKAECDCLENGKCVMEEGKYVCKCNSEYGYYKYIKPECRACKCGADSNCTFAPTLFSDKKKCICKVGYRDVNGFCQGPCSSNPCQNGGTCKDVKNGFECVCKDGYMGKVCKLKEIIDSSSTPITRLTDNYYSEKTKSFFPTTFISKQDEIGSSTITKIKTIKPSTEKTFPASYFPKSTTLVMKNTVLAQSSTLAPDCDCGKKSFRCLFDNDGEKVCLCLPGYSTKEGKCSDCYCGKYGTCLFDKMGDKVCLCSDGYSEKNGFCTGMCTKDDDCLNEGLCKWWRRDARFCECDSSFKGDRCEMNIMCEHLNPICAKMGAVCKRVGIVATCECPPETSYQWSSGKCENICDSHKCINGKCEITGLNYNCKCDAGFIGLNCDEKIENKQENNNLLISILVSVCLFTFLAVLGLCFIICRGKQLSQVTFNMDVSPKTQH